LRFARIDRGTLRRETHHTRLDRIATSLKCLGATQILVWSSAAIAALGLAACGSSEGGAKQLRFTLTDQGCSPEHASVAAGPVTFFVTNGGTSHTTELELRSSSGYVLGERENLVAGLSGSFSLDLQPGTYVLACPSTANLTLGTLTVTGKPHPETGPSEVLLKTAVLQYRTYVEGQTEALLAGVRRFATAIEQGNIAEAKRLFGPVRSHYEAIEPVASSFPGLDSDIDARIDAPTVNGDTAKWFGFHHIEQLMWVGHTLRGATPLANRLLSDVERLNQQVPSLPLAPEQLINGSVELLNEIVNVKISGEEDRYSHTDLSDFQANLLGARKAFEYVRPTLERTGSTALASTIAHELEAVQTELNAYRRNTPLGFALYSALSQTDKKRIAQQVGNAAQSLSEVALKITEGK
jgi:iron uptake system component EfeO